MLPHEILLYYPFDYKLELIDWNKDVFYFEIEIIKSNKSIQDKLEAFISTSTFKSSVQIDVICTKTVYEEIKNLPKLFSKDIEDRIIGTVLDKADLPDDIDTYLTFHEKNG